MKVDLFNFDLPPELIAQHPIEPRDAARMLVVDPDLPSGKSLRDAGVKDLCEHLNSGDVLVVNDTKVIPARLFEWGSNGKREVTLHRKVSDDTWLAFCKPARHFSVGERISWSADLGSVTLDRSGGQVTLKFSCEKEQLFQALERVGSMPLPPYIKRKEGPTLQDRLSYQTIFADKPGAVAAPTASLHFTPNLLSSLEAKGVRIASVTLHVGAGTFLPVRVEDTKDHAMHEEWWHLSPESADLINQARRVIAAGTTSLRTLETAACHDPSSPFRVSAGQGSTGLFITPGYDFRVTDLLLTNFHLPKSTLFMLVSAFSGLDLMKKAYAHAIREAYRFFSYGDCCLLKLGTRNRKTGS